MSDRDLVSAILEMEAQPLPKVDHTTGMSKEEFMAKFLYGGKR